MEEDENKFINGIGEYIDYWTEENGRTEKERLAGLAFSILRMLDGVAPNYRGSLHTLATRRSSKPLHHVLKSTKWGKHERRV